MERYFAVLDIISLTQHYPGNAYALASATQKTALAYLNKKASKKELQQLLQLGLDLGYIEQQAYTALRI